MAEPPLWTADELVAATGGKLIGAVGKPLKGVSIDTRTIAPGDIFVAIKGESHDAHDFVAKASHCWRWPCDRFARYRRDEGGGTIAGC